MATNTLLRAWRRVKLNLWMCVAATKRAVEHFNKAIETATAIGAKGIQGQAYLDLGRLHKAKGRNDQALDYFSRAVRIFEECEFEIYLKQGNEALESLQ